MATHWGNEGQVKVGAVTVAEVTKFEFNENVTTVADTAMGDGWETHIPNSGIKKWDGSMECHWDETDTTGQGVLLVGASITLNLYPEGSTTGDKYYTGLVSITSRGIPVPMDGDTIKCNFSFQGNGALTLSTVP
jgi:hypothetical protein